MRVVGRGAADGGGGVDGVGGFAEADAARLLQRGHSTLESNKSRLSKRGTLGCVNRAIHETCHHHLAEYKKSGFAETYSVHLKMKLLEIV